MSSTPAGSGEADRDHARKRELVAAATARQVVERLSEDRNLTAVAGREFNVGETDADKNGRDLADDRTDGYDDTHALMTLGLVDGLRLNRVRRLLRETDLPIAEIAARAGDRSAASLSAACRKSVGRSPRDDRRNGAG